MLLWTRSSRALVLGFFTLVVAVVFVAPIATVVAAALAGSWTGPLPSNLGGKNFSTALSDENFASLIVSLQTAFIAGALALIVGTWAALASREAPMWLRRITDAVFHLPIAVPSVAIGLGLLITFNERPLLLGGTKWIVILAHTVFGACLCLQFRIGRARTARSRLPSSCRITRRRPGAGADTGNATAAAPSVGCGRRAFHRTVDG